MWLWYGKQTLNYVDIQVCLKWGGGSVWDFRVKAEDTLLSLSKKMELTLKCIADY